MKEIRLKLPMSAEQIRSLQPGDKILLTGIVYTARDQAHKRILEMINKGEDLPFELSQTAIFYCGPSPAAPGKVCGAIGPTTSSRMDSFSEDMFKAGLRVMIGKGDRNAETLRLIRNYCALYLVAVGGVSAVLARSIVSCETFLWEELGAEAVFRVEFRDFPCYVYAD